MRHELLKAICGRWHSPLFPQPRRHQQMVGVKTLNIKRPPLIFSPGILPLTSSIFAVFWYFCHYLEANKEHLIAAECFGGFPGHLLFLRVVLLLMVLVLIFCGSL